MLVVHLDRLAPCSRRATIKIGKLENGKREEKKRRAGQEEDIASIASEEKDR
jgi:hypothetical protein